MTPVTEISACSLEDADDDVVAAVEQDGMVVVRGARASVASFQALAHRLATSFLSQEAGGFRDVIAEGVSSVVKGNSPLALHMERGYSPDKPELCFFLAIESATTGGEMLFGQGEALFDALPAALAQKLVDKRLVFKPQFGIETWKPRYGSREQIEARFPELPSIRSFRFLDDDVLEYEHVTPAIYAAPVPRFVNSLVLIWHNMMAGKNIRVARSTAVFFDDGERIDAELVDAILAAIDPVTAAIALQPGDVAVVDNFRYLHGRNAFTGPRKAAAAFGARGAAFR
jgi:alpha-ketoglutarate-dependent taurine dioxygenase